MGFPATSALRNFETVNTVQPSPAIWGRLPIPFERMVYERDYGVAFHDDFQDFPLAGTQTTQIAHGKYKIFNTGATKVDRVGSINSTVVPGGALRIDLDTDDDSGSLAQAYSSYYLSGSATTSGPLLFECRYAQNSIATNMAAVFFGLAEVTLWTLATGVPFNAGDAITNGAAAIGFRIEEDGLGVVDTVVSDRATSFTNIGDTEGGTLAANTFDNFGFIYDPNETTNCVVFFKNNQRLTTAYSRSTLTGLTNLDAGPVGLIIAACSDTAATYEGYLQWWRVAQLKPGIRLNKY